MPRRRVRLLAACLGLLLAAVAGWGASTSGGLTERLRDLASPVRSERSEGFFTLVDEQGYPLLRTGLGVARGDLFIDADNRHHRVTRVRGDIAETCLETPEGTPVPGAAMTLAASGAYPRPASLLTREAAASAVPAVAPQAMPLGTARQVIVIYHTHSDESYIPTDGADAIPGHGGVYDVGDAMAASLTAQGFTVVHDLAVHDPHDAGAYPRSRRTVLRDLQYGPSLIFDVHRDAAPASECITSMNGVETARVLIVVGGANPFYRANLSIANTLKGIADRLYPGIMRGILVARGNYNQDLYPSNILLEVGTHTIPKPPAEQAGTLWGTVVANYLGPPGPARPTSAAAPPAIGPAPAGAGR